MDGDTAVIAVVAAAGTSERNVLAVELLPRLETDNLLLSSAMVPWMTLVCLVNVWTVDTILGGFAGSSSARDGGRSLKRSSRNTRLGRRDTGRTRGEAPANSATPE
jgi:hypothetical protein